MSVTVEVVTVVSAGVGIVAGGVAPLIRWVLVAPSAPDARMARARKFRDERKELATYLDGIGEGDEANRQRERGDVALARALEQNDAARTLTLTGRMWAALATYAAFSVAISLIIVGVLARAQTVVLIGAVLLLFSGACLAVWAVLSLRAEKQREHLVQERAARLQARSARNPEQLQEGAVAK